MAIFSEKNEKSEDRPSLFTRLVRRPVSMVLIILLVLYAAGLLLELARPRMPGMNTESAFIPVASGDLQLLTDVTGVDPYGKQIISQEIFPALLKLIHEAQDVLVLDMFLVNRFSGARELSEYYRDVSAELIEALVDKKNANPEIFILFVTDPINAVYGVECPVEFQPLVDAGGHVVFTDLGQLPDSNRVYSPFYRVLRPLVTRLPAMHNHLLKNPFGTGAERVSPAQLLRLMNFKANHRKVALAGMPNGRLTALLSSANPHTASSAHSNMGLLLRNGPLAEMLELEYRVALATILHQPHLSYSSLKPLELVREIERRIDVLKAREPAAATAFNAQPDAARVQYLTDRAIGNQVDRMLREAKPGDRVDMLMFYLADPVVLQEIENAAHRGARIRLVLDPNKDAFGRQKNGIPNRITARRLQDWAEQTGNDISIRWMLTHGEQAHFKMMRVHNAGQGKDELLIGSANFTKRNLRGSNLEAAAFVENGFDLGTATAVVFNEIWENLGGILYTVPYAEFKPEGARWWLGRAWTAFGTATGVSTY